MVKSYVTKKTNTLIIVESPAKCKKIEEYLGAGYKCVACFGHFRELASLKDIDVGFSLKYTVCNKKKEQISLLSKLIKSSTDVVLATDDDREGEAIAWHICDHFKLDVVSTKRIVFHEITEQALQNAIRNPTTVNMNVVNAQKARQILDMLVGFKVSPMLWKCVSRDNSLSAGRCQTPALKIIYDNQQEINKSNESIVYNTVGYFTSQNIPFELNKQYTTEDEITDFLDGTADFNHTYICTKPVNIVKNPPEPFTTSRLQQVASNELRFSPKETMNTCQTLYEGGFITYMRTESKSYCDQFLNSAKKYISSVYDERYVSPSIQRVASIQLGTNTQLGTNIQGDKKDPHEAIRVTDFSKKELPETFDSREKRMYKLIWTNTLASCMSNAIYSSVTATISGFQNTKFVRTSEQIVFAGWATLFPIPENKDYQTLQIIDNTIQYKKIVSRVTVKNIKSHYSEARLVQLLEDKGIGRPSTFAMLVEKIQERGYVKKENIEGREILCNDFELTDGDIFEMPTKRTFGQETGKLVLQPIGVIVMEFLNKHFSDIFNYDYTREMEASLDKVSSGDLLMQDLCDKCNNQVESLVGLLKDETKIEIQIDDNNTYLIGKYGPVIKSTEKVDGKITTTFKKVLENVDIHTIENGNINEIVDCTKANKPVSYILGKFEDEDVVLKKGKFGLYISWGKNNKALKELGNRPIESITFEEIQKYLNEGSNLVRTITPFLSIRKGPKGDYLFYKSEKMKKPVFHSLNGFEQDYKKCNNAILKSWCKETYSI
jgi:DNA topoisomerase I